MSKKASPVPRRGSKGVEISMTSSIPNQYFFVNKSVDSNSLSHSQPGERFFIHSHVHGRQHKIKKASQQSSPVSAKSSPKSPTEETGNSKIQQKVGITSGVDEDADSRRDPYKSSWLETCSQPQIILPFDEIGSNAIDPFYCSAAPVDAKGQRLLGFTFKSGFLERSFKAEAMASDSQIGAPTSFRHIGGVEDRLRLCVVDESVMLTTLAYCSSALNWSTGWSDKDTPKEVYIVKGIGNLRQRLAAMDHVDNGLMLSVYALAVCDLWAENYNAAASHLQMIRHLSGLIGGLNNTTSYIMEGILLVDKYVAMHFFAPPILQGEWCPTRLPADKLHFIRLQMGSASNKMAQGFLELSDKELGIEMKGIVRDFILFIEVIEYARSITIADAEEQQWLFLQNQSLGDRLLSASPSSIMEECCRIAVMMWLLKNIKYFGSQRWSKRLAPRLRHAVSQADGQTARSEPKLFFWVIIVGAMVSLGTEDEDWYLQRAMLLSHALGIKFENNTIQSICESFLFLLDETNQLNQIVAAVQESGLNPLEPEI